MAAAEKICMSFWYHMWGFYMGSLRVFKVASGIESLLWEKSGDQGNQWHEGTVNITSNSTFKVNFKSSVNIKDQTVNTNDLSKGIKKSSVWTGRDEAILRLAVTIAVRLQPSMKFSSAGDEQECNKGKILFNDRGVFE